MTPPTMRSRPTSQAFKCAITTTLVILTLMLLECSLNSLPTCAWQKLVKSILPFLLPPERVFSVAKNILQMERSTIFRPLWIYIYIMANSHHYIFCKVYAYRCSIFTTSYHTISLCLVSCTSMVPTLRGLISHRVQNCNIFRQERSNCFKFGVYIEGSCHY